MISDQWTIGNFRSSDFSIMIIDHWLEEPISTDEWSMISVKITIVFDEKISLIIAR
jgi:hypothetical protein